jgi:hypothetical protein
MPLVKAYVGSFTLAATGGVDTVTRSGIVDRFGASFTPTVLLFLMPVASGGFTRAMSFGAVTAALSEAVHGAMTNRTSPARSAVGRPHVGGRVQTPDSSQIISFTVSNFQSGSFDTTRSVTGSPGDQTVIFIALGGDVQGKIGTLTVPSGTAPVSQTTSGLGIGQVTGLILFMDAATTAEGNGGSGNINLGVGWAAGVSARSYSVMRSVDNVTTTVARRIQSASKVWGSISNTGLLNEVDVTSFGNSEFTLSWTTNTRPNDLCRYLALSSVDLAAGSIDENASTGNQSITGLARRPLACLFQSANAATASGNQATGRKSLGFGGDQGSGALGQGNGFAGQDDATAAGSADAVSTVSASTLLQMRDPDGTLQDELTLSTLNSDGLTFNIGTASGTAKELLYLAFLDGQITPAVGSLALAGLVPSAVRGTRFQPLAGALVLTGLETRVGRGTLLRPAIGAAVLTGQTPELVGPGGSARTPTVGSVVLAGQIAAPVQGTVLTPKIARREGT